MHTSMQTHTHTLTEANEHSGAHTHMHTHNTHKHTSHACTDTHKHTTHQNQIFPSPLPPNGHHQRTVQIPCQTMHQVQTFSMPAINHKSIWCTFNSSIKATVITHISRTRRKKNHSIPIPQHAHTHTHTCTLPTHPAPKVVREQSTRQ